MPEIPTTARNIAILLVIAGLVDVVPGGGAASNTALQFVYLSFLGAFAWIASRLYREHRRAVYSLGERRRTIAYIALGVGAVVLTATGRLWNTGPGGIVWIILIAGCGYALFEVIRSAQRY